MRVCDICADPEHQPVSRASVHVRGKSGGAFDICDECLDKAAANRSPVRSVAAKKRLQPWVPRELTDSEPEPEA